MAEHIPTPLDNPHIPADRGSDGPGVPPSAAPGSSPVPSPGLSVAFPGVLAAPDAATVLRAALGAPRASGATEKAGKEDIAVVLRPLWGPDLTQDLIETLEALSPVNLQPHQLGDIFRRRLHNGIKTYVACVRVEDKERVVATATLILEQRFAHGGSIAGHIEDVAVHPLWQRRGIGRKLVGFVLQQAWELKCRKVTLNCAPHLEDFYGPLGLIKKDVFLRADNPNL